MKPITEAFYLRHSSGQFVCVRASSLTLEDSPIAAPVFNASNMGKGRASDWHRGTHAAARKRWPRALSRCAVASRNGVL
jgi:hypothetical protein